MSSSTGVSHERQALHRLIDSLDAEDVRTAQRILEALNASRDPLLAKLLTAPYDDEAETEEERLAVQEARRERDEGRVISHEELKKQFGL